MRQHCLIAQAVKLLLYSHPVWGEKKEEVGRGGRERLFLIASMSLQSPQYRPVNTQFIRNNKHSESMPSAGVFIVRLDHLVGLSVCVVWS